MRILMVSWTTLPNRGGSSVIAENLARCFSADQMVVLGGKQPFQNTSYVRDPKGPKFIYFPSELYIMGRGYRYLVWFRRWRFKPLIKKIKEIIREEKIDYVLGVYPNPFYLHAACKAAKELGIPFSSYFHNTYIDSEAINEPEAERIQSFVFKYSEHIFVMSDGMKRFYDEKYKLQKFVTLPHSFSTYPSKGELSGLPGKKDKYKLVAIGNFNESNIEATIRFVEAIKDNPKYSLSLMTHVPNILLRKRGLDVSAIENAEFVSPDEVHDRLQSFDICVLTHGFSGEYGEVEYRTIFPTRTIPFLLSGKPIFAHAPPHAFISEFLDKNSCAELVTNRSKKEIVEGLDKIADNIAYQQELVNNARQTSAMFHTDNVVRTLRDTIQSS